MAHVSEFLNLSRLERLGFHAQLDVDGLFTVTPADRLTPDLRHLLTLYRAEIVAELLMHQPQPIPWNDAVAESLIRRTVNAFGTLQWPHNFVPNDVRYQQAEAAIDDAYRRHDLHALTLGYRHWWQTLKLLVAERTLTDLVPQDKEEITHV